MWKCQEVSLQNCGLDSKNQGMLDIDQEKVVHVLPEQIVTDTSG